MDVLVPVDGSNSDRATVEHTIREYPEASITVLHVLTPGMSSFTIGGLYCYDTVLESQQKRAEELFATVTEIADDHGSSIATRTVIGDPNRDIVAFADECDSDHIIIGGCEYYGIKRLLIGSVTESVVRRAAIPVTVVQ